MKDIKWFTILGLGLSLAAVVGSLLGMPQTLALALVGLTLVILDK